MNQGASGQMMDGDDDMPLINDLGGHPSKVPSFGFYNDFDDVLADD